MSAERSKLYVDLSGFITPSVITGDQLRPDLLLAIENKVLYVLELTVGFETNLTLTQIENIKNTCRLFQIKKVTMIR
jgi:hypothetical protein